MRFHDGNIIYRNSKNQLHREDGPAVEDANGSKFWYINGKLHREDGPAFEYANGFNGWFLFDVQYSLEDWLKTRNWNDTEKVEFFLKFA